MSDLIDRDALIAAYDAAHKGPPGGARKLMVEAAAVEAVPVRHGRWIGMEYDGYADGCPVYDVWACSECDEEHEGDETTLTNFCPNCGADLREVEKDGL